MVLLILESLGSTELLFILVMALVFFGPRKLPQISRSLGKNLAEFRRASEDFKRTWDREVSLEQTDGPGTVVNGGALSESNSILDRDKADQPTQQPTIQAVAPDRVVARHSFEPEAPHPSGQIDSLSAGPDLDGVNDEPTSTSKHDWL